MRLGRYTVHLDRPEFYFFVLAVVIGLLTWARSQDKPSTPSTAPTVSADTRLQLLNAYKSAIIAQENVGHAQQRFQQMVATFNQLQSDRAKADKFPEGTTFTVNLDTDEVTPVLPKPPESKNDTDGKKGKGSK